MTATRKEAVMERMRALAVNWNISGYRDTDKDRILQLEKENVSLKKQIDKLLEKNRDLLNDIHSASRELIDFQKQYQKNQQEMWDWIQYERNYGYESESV